MPDLIIPHDFTQKTKAKASEVNDNFDAVAAWASALDLGNGGAGLVLGDLPSSTPANIIVCNASGVPQYRAGSGAVAISNAGAFSINHYHAQMAIDTALAVGSWTTLNSLEITPAAGSYLVFAKFWALSTANWKVRGRILSGFTQVDFTEVDINEVVDFSATVSMMGAITLDGATSIGVQADAVTFAGSPTASWGHLTLLRVS